MAAEEPEFADDDSEDAGARKSFWEHVQDLRVALIRSAIAIGLAVMVCLLLTPQIVNVLSYPIRRMNFLDKPAPTVVLEIGSSTLGPYKVTRDEFPGLPPGAAPHAVYRVGTMQVGQQQVMTLTPDSNAKPEASLDVQLLNLGPAEAFTVAFQVALYAAIVVSAPFWAYYLGGFIVPALRRRERTAIFSWLGWSVALGITGVLLTYFVVLPLSLRASIIFSNLLHFSATQWRADDYVSFACKFLLGMGVGFQFPIVVLFLVKIGLLNHKQLAHYRRHVIVVCLILGAILTTPEVMTQIAMAVPLYLLYEVSIWVAWYWDWKKRRQAPA